jgi:hypothetical protein
MEQNGETSKLWKVADCLVMTSRSPAGPPDSDHGDPGSSPGQFLWVLWWTERHWGRLFPSTSVSPVTHSFH